MKIDFVQPVAIAVEGAEHRRVLVCFKSELNCFGPPQKRAQFGQLLLGPFGIFATECLAKCDVGLQ